LLKSKSTDKAEGIVGEAIHFDCTLHELIDHLLLVVYICYYASYFLSLKPAKVGKRCWILQST
jgi:hypothetical protein